MFEKQVSKPVIISQLEVLQNRCPNLNLKEQLSTHWTGFNGEKSISYYLNSPVFTPVKIFHNIRLAINKQFFQVDFLLLTKNFILLLECKNIHGTLIVEEKNGQFIRHKGNNEEGFINPIQQVQKQADLLSLFLQESGAPLVPILTNIVIAQPSTILKIPNPVDAKKFIHAYQLEEHFKKLTSEYSQEIYSTSKVNQLSKLLLMSNCELSLNWKNRFSIAKEDIKSGIYCDHCKQFSMSFYYNRCICYSCNKNDNLALLQALQDYYHLFGPFMSTNECKNWLNLDSDKIARKVLKLYSEHFSGHTKKKIYRLEWNRINKG